MRAWANRAGLAEESTGSSTWTYAGSESAGWWGDSQAERVRTSSFTAWARARAQEQGLSPSKIEHIADAWQDWGRSPDAWFCMPHGELIAHPGPGR